MEVVLRGGDGDVVGPVPVVVADLVEAVGQAHLEIKGLRKSTSYGCHAPDILILLPINVSSGLPMQEYDRREIAEK